MEEESECTQVCYICGDRGFFDLLIYCSLCFDLSVHKYCLGVIPGSINDIDDVYWACENCCPSTEPEPTCEMSGDASAKNNEETCSEDAGSLKFESEIEILLDEDQPEPLQILLPMLDYGRPQQTGTGDQFSIAEDSASVDFSDEARISSFMDYPQEIMSRLVLLVTPSGEIFTHVGMSSYDDVHSRGLEAFNLSLTSSLNEVSSDDLIPEHSPYIVKSESGPDFDKTVNKYTEIEHDFSAGETVELDPGTDVETEACHPGETVELDIGSDEEIEACYPSEPPGSNGIEEQTGEDRLVDDCDQNMEAEVQQVNEASQVYVPHQPAQTDYKFVPLPMSKRPLKQVHRSQDSMGSLNDMSSCKSTLHLSIEVSKGSKMGASSEISIPASAIEMGGEFLESSLEMVVIQVGRYNIRSDLASILRNILDKYGDVFINCAIEPDSLLVNVCKVIQFLQRVPFTRLQYRHIAYVRDALILPDALGIDVKWLSSHCDYLEKLAHQIRQYPGLKRELAQTIASVRSKERMVQGAELESTKEHVGKLQGAIQEIVALCRRAFRKTLADGLF